jgi:hypothetical protein
MKLSKKGERHVRLVLRIDMCKVIVVPCKLKIAEDGAVVLVRVVTRVTVAGAK